MRWPAVLFLSVPGRCGCHHPGNKVCVKTEEPAHFLPDPISHHSLGPGLVHAYISVLSLKKLVVLPITLRGGALRITPSPIPSNALLSSLPRPFLRQGSQHAAPSPTWLMKSWATRREGRRRSLRGRLYVGPQGIGSWSWGGRLERGRVREALLRVAIKT